MHADFAFFLVAIIAVVLVGLSKGGLGGAFGLMGVPILSIVMPPMQAAAILLPILLVMDVAALWAWRHFNDRKTLWILMPGAIAGIALGWATSSYVSANAMRLVLGAITLIFVLRYVVETVSARRGQTIAPKEHNTPLASFWGAVAGYTSFVAHAGGPPYQIYTLPLKLDPKNYTGASVRFFAVLNLIKVLPYFALGELDTQNLTLSALLFPLAFLSTLVGAWIVKRMKPEIFYPFIYATVALTAAKLLWDGIAGL